MVDVTIENARDDLTKDDLLDMFIPDLDDFRDKTLKFAAKEISVNEYKGFSGGYGSYAQRGGTAHMLRLRMAGGRITRERLKYIVDSMEKYEIPRAKLTTCQSVQFHDVKAEVLTDAMKDAWDAGMVSRGGGGDFSRNIMVSPLSGVEQGEYLDCLPYAEAESAYVMQFVKRIKLPRKLKICFCTNGKNETHATFRDLGFVARPDGRLDVYIAGGLGNNPQIGVKVAEGVEPNQIRYYIRAMVATFVENGNFKNRGRARTRYMQLDLGIDALKAAFAKNLADAYAGEDITVPDVSYVVSKKGNGETIIDKRVIPQKQEGLYAVFYQPVGGQMVRGQFVSLWETIKDMDQVEIRLTPEEGMYIINCNAEEARKVLEATSDSALTLFETSVACIGATTCQVGLRDSQTALAACIAAVRPENFADGVLPRIHISGCPSSCGTHQIGAIGFRGAVKQTTNGPQPAFNIFLGGCAEAGKENLAPMGKSMLQADMPKFFVELGRMIAAENTTYDQWIIGHQDQLNELVAKYTA